MCNNNNANLNSRYSRSYYRATAALRRFLLKAISSLRFRLPHGKTVYRIFHTIIFSFKLLSIWVIGVLLFVAGVSLRRCARSATSPVAWSTQPSSSGSADALRILPGRSVMRWPSWLFAVAARVSCDWSKCSTPDRRWRWCWNCKIFCLHIQL